MMKLTTTALALVLAAASAPAFAQYGSAPPSGTTQPQAPSQRAGEGRPRSGRRIRR